MKHSLPTSLCKQFLYLFFLSFRKRNTVRYNIGRLLVGLIIIGTGCTSTVIVNSDIKQNSVKPVSLSEYTSVQMRDSTTQDPTLAIGVSISGGGSRAQYFGLGVLMGMEEIKATSNTSGRRNLLQDVDYFSTVSGGGFAAGYYLTLRKNNLIRPDQSLLSYWLSKDHGIYTEGINYNASISTFIGSNYKRYEHSRRKPSFPDRVDNELMQKDRPTPDSKSKIQSIVLGDLFKTNGEIPALPMLVANGTIYNNSERLPFMPHIISALEITSSRMPKEPLNSGTNKYNDGYTIPLKYAIAASSAFPGLVPQVKLRIEPRAGHGRTLSKNQLDTLPKFIRIVDGGVVDNLGYVTLLELLGEEKVQPYKKRAIVIDCSGVGIEERYASEYLRRSDILTHSLFFTLQSKYVTFKTNMESTMSAYSIPTRNYIKIGITDLRDAASNIVDTINQVQQKVDVVEANKIQKGSDVVGNVTDPTVTLTDINIMDSLRAEVGHELSRSERNKRWDKFYDKFELLVNDRIKKYNLTLEPVDLGIKVSNLDRIRSSDFGKFGPKDKVLLVLLYELASLVETNVRIRSEAEKSILVLAGRYTVYLNRDKLAKLYGSNP